MRTLSSLRRITKRGRAGNRTDRGLVTKPEARTHLEFPAFPLTEAPGAVTWNPRALPQPCAKTRLGLPGGGAGRGRGGARAAGGGGAARGRGGAARRIMGCGGGMALGA
jgi:hypothetical protein